MYSVRHNKSTKMRINAFYRCDIDELLEEITADVPDSVLSKIVIENDMACRGSYWSGAPNSDFSYDYFDKYEPNYRSWKDTTTHRTQWSKHKRFNPPRIHKRAFPTFPRSCEPYECIDDMYFTLDNPDGNEIHPFRRRYKAALA